MSASKDETMRCIRGLIALIREAELFVNRKFHKEKFSSFVDLWSLWKWKRNEKFSRINSTEKKIFWEEKETLKLFLSRIWIRMKCAAIELADVASACLNLILSRRDDLRFWFIARHCSSIRVIPRSLLMLETLVLNDLMTTFVLWSWGLGFFCHSSSAPIHPFRDVTIQLKLPPARLEFYFENEAVGTHRGVISVTRRMNLRFDWENFLRP